jgi:DNA-binding transcriptional LysR family regulator
MRAAAVGESSFTMDIQDLRIFVRVASVQNLSAVGTELALTPGTISKRIQALEEELGVRLFDRTTRSIRITAEGTTFLDHAQRILEELDKARASVGDNVSKPKGKLKISAPASLARQLVAPAICAFVRAYPEIDVQIDLSDRIVNLQEEGYDVAIRCGVLTDSSLIAKRLANDREIIVAAPPYLSEHGAPQLPEHLSLHQCLVLGEAWSWTIDRDNAPTSVRVSARLRSNDGELLRHAAIEGLGLLRTSQIRVQEDMAAGRLVRVLEAFEVSGDAAIWAVYPGPRHVLPKLRVLLDFLGEWFKTAVGDMPPVAAPAPRPKLVEVTSLRAR